MKSLKSFLIAIGVAAVLGCPGLWGPLPAGASPEMNLASAGKASASRIRWVSYEEGLRRGRREGKKVFLNFYADWCHYCQVMEDKTFRDNAVAAYLNDHYIAVQVNSDRERKIAEAYKVQGLPTTFFLSEDGGSIGSQPGYIPPDVMLPLLKYIHTDSYKKMDFDKFQEGR